MGIERFPASKARLKKAMKDKTAGFNVQLTPVGQSTHVRSGFMDPDCLAIAIPDSTQAFIVVNREDLEQRSNVIDGETNITVSESVALRAIELIDAEIAGKPKLIKSWKSKLKSEFREVRHRLARLSRAGVKSKRERELEKENRRLKDQINKEAGTLVELQIAGLIPMGSKPPIPLRNIHRMHYGCDWLSIAWKGDELHLFFIESNLNRSDSTTSLTNIQSKFRSAFRGGNVYSHHVHHWMDRTGFVRWERSG